MTLEQRIEQLTSRMQKLNDIVARYPGPGFTDGIFDSEAAPIKPETLRHDALAMAEEGRNLRVGIIGRVKAGKSSLLNALMFEGKDVLPKAATPMTASLTVLRHTQQEQPYAEVEYFTQADVEDMHLLAEEYDARFQQLLEKAVKEAQEKAARPGTRATTVSDPERIKKKITNELNADPRLGGAKDMYARIEAAGGLLTHDNQPQRIDGHDIDDLQQRLSDYVGAEGKFTPFTKCLSLYLPLPALQGVDVVDTPGVNDPIRSREERTMEELHRCDVVFVVSPSGQFLNQQDMELMGRLAYKDGVREVFLVASQIDGQMFGSEREKHGGRLNSVLEGLHRTLAEQARNTLEALPSGNHGLDTLKRQLSKRLVVTSSVAYALATQPEASWDENTRHVGGLLSRNYPEECTTLSAASQQLGAMAGISQSRHTLELVLDRKQSITEEKIDAFLVGQSQALQRCLTQAPQVVGENRDELLNAKADSLEAQLEQLQKIRSRAVRVTNLAVDTTAEKVADGLSNRIGGEIQKRINVLEQTTASAKSSYTRSYEVDRDGLVAWGARLFGVGGKESRSETVKTINATEIRNVLQKVHSEFSEILTVEVNNAREGLTTTLEKAILEALRNAEEKIDKDIDSLRLAESVHAAVKNLRYFDTPTLPPLPSALMQNGTLKGSEAREFEEMALSYYNGKLKADAREQSGRITREFCTCLENADIGSKLFAHYESHLNGIKQQIQHRDQTLQRYDQLLAELKELQHV